MSITTFISTWNTVNISAGSSANNQIMLPLANGGHNFIVDWGDGNTDTITGTTSPERIHTYASSGVYTIQIDGLINGWSFNNIGDKLKLLDIVQWGDLHIGNGGYYFWGCSNMTCSATDNLYLAETNSMLYMFYGCINFSGNLSGWNVSTIYNMNGAFYACALFNSDISGWNVSNVADMYQTFYGCSSFNNNISGWMFTSLLNLHSTFGWCTSFNQPIGAWDVSQMVDMSNAFYNCSSFDQDLSAWDVSSVADMTGVFQGCGISSVNYDKLLESWALLSVQSNVVFDVAPSKFTFSALASREVLRSSPNNWSITDGGMIGDIPTTSIGNPIGAFFGVDKIISVYFNGDKIYDWSGNATTTTTTIAP